MAMANSRSALCATSSCTRMMPWPERRAGAELSQRCFVRITSMLAVQWHTSKRAFRATVLFTHHCDASTRTVDASSHGQTAYGAAASAKSDLHLATYADTRLCSDLEVLPTHHLPWAGLGSIWPHGLGLTSDVRKGAKSEDCYTT